MYIPAHFAADDDWSGAFLSQARIGTLVTRGKRQLHANVFPMLLDHERNVLSGHLARANAQWQDIADASDDALAIFSGADAYVSPSFYASKAEHHRVVPTWNYEAVHVYGSLRFQHDAMWLLNFLNRLTAREESARALPWEVSDAPADFIDGLLNNIVGFELTIARVDAKRKLSQNRSEADRWGVIAGLRENESDARAKAIADTMETLGDT